MSHASKLELFQKESMPRLLLRMGLPTTVGMLVTALYNIVDAYFVGALGTGQMAAVSVTFPIVQVVIGLGLLFGSGAGSFIARLLGANNLGRAHQTASTSLLLSLLVGGAVIGFCMVFQEGLLTVLGATPTIMPYAKEYAMWYIPGAMFNVFNVTVSNLMTAQGAARLSMTTMLIGAGLNAVLDPLFIFTFQMGVAGAAIATVLAQSVSFFIYLWYLLKKKGVLQFSIKHVRFEREILTQIFKIGIPIFAVQFFTSLCMGLTNLQASQYGDSAVAAVGIALRIVTLGSYVVLGFSKGFQPVAGFCYGAKLYDRLKEAIRLSVRWTTLFCILMTVLFFLFAPNLVGLFTKQDTQVIALGSKALRFLASTFATFGCQIIYSSLFLALGRAAVGGLLTMGRQGFFFLPFIFLMPALFGFTGILLAQPIADLITFALTLVFASSLSRQLNTLPAEGATV